MVTLNMFKDTSINRPSDISHQIASNRSSEWNNIAETTRLSSSPPSRTTAFGLRGWSVSTGYF